jgi:dTDP-L-rhamnose 4-epimerase
MFTQIMRKKVLVTSGAAFVGSHLADELLQNKYDVHGLDNLAPQVHDSRARRPVYLARDVEFIRGHIRDADTVRRGVRRLHNWLRDSGRLTAERLVIAG